jgi:hypothetical protein
VCDSLSLKVFVKAVYNSEEVDGVACLLKEVECPIETGVVGDILMYLEERYGGTLVFDSDKTSSKELEDDEVFGFEDVRPILWLRPLNDINPIGTEYVAEGDETSLKCVNGEICLV